MFFGNEMLRDYTAILKDVKIIGLVISVILLFSGTVNAQSDKKLIRQGNREYEKGKFSESEISYRRATDKNKNSPDAVFNTGDALYKQKKFEDAGKEFTENIRMSEDKKKKSAGLYNLGNSLFQANKLQESIEAYKGSLKLQPDNMEAKYNLAYAQDQLKKQQEQQQQQQQQQNKDKQDQNKNKNKQDKEKNQQDKNNENKQQQNNEKQDKNKQAQQEQQQTISKDDAQRLLNALANEEKKVQEKVKLEQAAKDRVKTAKNW